MSAQEFAARCSTKPEEFMQDVLSSCIIRDDGGIEVEPNVWQSLLAKHNPRGVGTAVYHMLHPIAEVLGLDNCNGCAKRMEQLNEITS